MNYQAVDAGMTQLARVQYPCEVTSKIKKPPVVREDAPEFVHEVTAEIMAGRGDDLPVSKMPVDGRFPLSTTMWEKRNIAVDIPVWEPEMCIQCGRCSLLCPHASIRMKAYDESLACQSPGDVQERRRQGQAQGQEGDRPGRPRGLHRLRPVRAELPGPGEEPRDQGADRPPRDQHGVPGAAARERARELGFLPFAAGDRSVPLQQGDAFRAASCCRPCSSSPGACAGCGETPYVKLVTPALR